MTEAKRGRPRKHPSWTDGSGRSRALREHPNEPVCRNFQARASWTDEQIEAYVARKGRMPIIRPGSNADYWLVDEWFGSENLAAFAYGVAAEIGMRPGRYFDLKPRDPSKPIGPGNVRWVQRPQPDTDRARAFRAQRAGRVISLPGGGYVFGVFVDSLVHKGSCESPHLDVLDCSCCSAEVEVAIRY